MNYLQPEFYHFSEFSILLAKELSHLLIKHSQINTLIDYCAGCGVIGLETLTLDDEKIKRLVFYEKQEEFHHHIENNIRLYQSHHKERNLDFYINQDDLILDKEQTCMVCNPPFYLDENTRVSPNLSRQRCHSFESFKHFEDFFIELKTWSEKVHFLLLGLQLRKMHKSQLKIIQSFVYDCKNLIIFEDLNNS